MTTKIIHLPNKWLITLEGLTTLYSGRSWPVILTLTPAASRWPLQHNADLCSLTLTSTASIWHLQPDADLCSISGTWGFSVCFLIPNRAETESGELGFDSEAESKLACLISHNHYSLCRCVSEIWEFRHLNWTTVDPLWSSCHSLIL